MITIEQNNPLTWNKPGWEANSCYANASLWALLYDNVFLNLIQNTNTQIANKSIDITKKDAAGVITKKTIDAKDVNDNRGLIQTNLIAFHDNIINNNTEINPKNFYNTVTRIIRTELDNITNNNWTTTPEDPEDFLMAISNQFTDIYKCTENNQISNTFLPIVRLGQYDTIQNTDDKIIEIKEQSKRCDFNQNNNNNNSNCDGLIVQYGQLGLKIKEKYNSIGKYELYAFLHYINQGHYACYFKFNNKWYIFDDYENNHEGIIVEANMLNIGNHIDVSHLFFYKINSTLNLGKNILLSDMYKVNQENQQVNQENQQVKQGNQQVKQGNQQVKQIAVYNECDKAGQDWLDLFRGQNNIIQNKDGTISVEIKNKDGTITKLTRTAADNSCTFAQLPKSVIDTEFIEGNMIYTGRDKYNKNIVIDDKSLKEVYDLKFAADNSQTPIPIWVVKNDKNVYTVSEKYLNDNGYISNTNLDNIKSNYVYTKEGKILAVVIGIFFDKVAADAEAEAARLKAEAARLKAEAAAKTSAAKTISRGFKASKTRKLIAPLTAAAQTNTQPIVAATNTALVANNSTAAPPVVQTPPAAQAATTELPLIDAEIDDAIAKSTSVWVVREKNDGSYTASIKPKIIKKDTAGITYACKLDGSECKNTPNAQFFYIKEKGAIEKVNELNALLAAAKAAKAGGTRKNKNIKRGKRTRKGKGKGNLRNGIKTKKGIKSSKTKKGIKTRKLIRYKK